MTGARTLDAGLDSNSERSTLWGIEGRSEAYNNLEVANRSNLHLER